jgi:hypothetical protein
LYCMEPELRFEGSAGRAPSGSTRPAGTTAFQEAHQALLDVFARDLTAREQRTLVDVAAALVAHRAAALADTGQAE